MAAVVVVLVIVDVVLIALALARTASEQNGNPGPIPTYSSTPLATATPSATPTPTPAAGATADPATEVASGRRLLSAVNGQEAWRASSGTCGADDVMLEHTADGTTWTPVSLGSDVTSVLALSASTSAVSVVAGTGDDCTPVVRTSVDDGASWTAAAAGAAGAGISSDGDSLILRSGTVDSPCQNPTDVFQGDRTTAVVCQDAIEWRAGSPAWVNIPMTGVRALTVSGDNYTLARIGVDGCTGVRIDSMPATDVTTNTQSTTVGCAKDTDADDSGAFALARVGQVLWLWAGNATLVSTDGGASW